MNITLLHNWVLKVIGQYSFYIKNIYIQININSYNNL